MIIPNGGTAVGEEPRKSDGSSVSALHCVFVGIQLPIKTVVYSNCLLLSIVKAIRQMLVR